MVAVTLTSQNRTPCPCTIFQKLARDLDSQWVMCDFGWVQGLKCG